MDDSISSLTASDSWWGTFLVVSTLIVLVGVAGEAIVELTKWLDKCPNAKKIIEVSAVFVLIVGVAGELLGEGKTISIGDQISGFLNEKAERANERASNAAKSASDANLKAEQLKSENLAFENILAPRRVFLAIPKEKFFLITDLDKFRGTRRYCRSSQISRRRS